MIGRFVRVNAVAVVDVRHHLDDDEDNDEKDTNTTTASW